MNRIEYNILTGEHTVIPLTQAEIDYANSLKSIEDAAKALAESDRLGNENYKALIRREADALDAAGEPYKAIKLLKTIGE